MLLHVLQMEFFEGFREGLAWDACCIVRRCLMGGNVFEHVGRVHPG